MGSTALNGDENEVSRLLIFFLYHLVVEVARSTLGVATHLVVVASPTTATTLA
uniref:Uncharacterized protein n=1 Tax=Oryza sativa subsp. japonica TaxID=39947 RepID=Q6ZII5_ORYSJ|nr:hypothetical protein [Oryza sativa Japonica Group]